jgi:pimeloyl-ACP methyl ester carboxylesterase
MQYIREGSGTALVLQHGIFSGSGYWLQQINAFSRTCDVVAPDLPGFAGSAGLNPPESIEGFAAALVNFLDSTLGTTRFSLVGHSLGGMVAQQVALDFPERLERLVLYGTSPIGEIPGRFESIAQSAERLKDDGMEETLVRFAKTWFKSGDKDPNFDVCLKVGQGIRMEAAIKTLLAISKWDVSERLSEIRTPVLVVCGDSDIGAPPEMSIALYRNLPNAQLAILPNAAHNLHMERPKLFNTTLAGFLHQG